jgi:hypothetical protein
MSTFHNIESPRVPRLYQCTFTNMQIIGLLHDFTSLLLMHLDDVNRPSSMLVAIRSGLDSTYELCKISNRHIFASIPPTIDLLSMRLDDVPQLLHLLIAVILRQPAPERTAITI